MLSMLFLKFKNLYYLNCFYYSRSCLNKAAQSREPFSSRQLTAIIQVRFGIIPKLSCFPIYFFYTNCFISSVIC